MPSLRWIWLFSICLSLFGASYFNGYVTARFMKSTGIADWPTGATASALLFPGLTLAIILFVDIIEWMERASDAPAITTFAVQSILWMLISWFCCYFGALRGYKAEPYAIPQKANPVLRTIPSQPIYLHLKVLMPICGALTFASFFVEFQYVWNSVWRAYMYNMYFYLTACMLLLIFIVAELSVVVTYF
jgi:hypothetical protein